MTPEDFETALIAKIESLKLPVLPYPEKPGKHYPESDPGEVLVRYEGRKPLSRDISGQLSTVKHYFEIVVVSRQVRGENGAYFWLQKIYQELEGFTLDGAAGALFLEVESFMDENDGIWQFGQKWSLTEDQVMNLSDSYYDDSIGSN